MGIFEEMEDAKITGEKTKISRLKRRSVIDHNSRDQIEHSDIKLSKLVNTTLLPVISELWHLTTFHCDFDNRRLLSLPRNHMKPLKTTKIVH